ncbi:MAG TPA: hypothetical protein PLO16_04850 [Acidocella sp.]|nr:hypothetical protein [Acidocella sp.]
MLLRNMIISGLFLLLGLVAQAHAGSPPVLNSFLTVGLVQQGPDGVKIVPVKVLQPGEVIAYTATYENKGGSAIDGLIVKIPVPAGTTYIRTGTSPQPAEASNDNVHFAPIPPPSKDDPSILPTYRAIEWNIGDLAPGQTRTVRIYVTVDKAS